MTGGVVILRVLAMLAVIVFATTTAHAADSVTPSDELFSKQWALKQIRAPQAWKQTVGSKGVTLAIIDTGVVPHPDLKGRVIGGYDFISDPDNAGDGDGRDDDPTDTGDTSDTSSGLHGTSIAGIAAAISDNGMGIAGVDWKCRLVIARVLGINQASGIDTDIADAIRWSAGLHVDGVPDNEHPAEVINMSFGSPGRSGAMQDAIRDALAEGVIIVASAGNAGEDASRQSPGGLEGVITVGAVGPLGKRAVYSNFGPKVTLMAPGGTSANGILSTSGIVAETYSYAPLSEYAKNAGTSEAAAFVSGTVTLLKGIDPHLNYERARDILTSSANPESQCNKGCGAGLLDVEAATKAAENRLGAPDPLHDGYACSFATTREAGGSYAVIIVSLALLSARRRAPRPSSNSAARGRPRS